MLKPIEAKALKLIRNSVAHRGMPPSIRELSTQLNYQSSNSATRIIDRLVRTGYIKKRPSGRIQLVEMIESGNSAARTVDVPIVGVAPCGAPLLAEENIEGYISVSTNLAKPGHRYFILRTVGDSMDKVIPEDSFVLVKQQPAADHNGQNVVALIDDEATIKSIHKKGGSIFLVPQSKNNAHQPILMENDFLIQGVVEKVLPKNLYNLQNG